MITITVNIGGGTVLMSPGVRSTEGFIYAATLGLTELFKPVPVPTEFDRRVDNIEDDISKKIYFQFSNVEGIDAMIRSLNKVRVNLVKYQCKPIEEFEKDQER